LFSDTTDVAVTAEQGHSEATHEKWMDVELGHLSNAKHQDSVFSNELLEEFSKCVLPHIFEKTLFQKVFIEEKLRQWKCVKIESKIDSSLQFLKSKNMAAIGDRLDSNYIPKPNDSHILQQVSKKLEDMIQQAESKIKELQEHDANIHESNGRKLKKVWMAVHHEGNLKWIGKLS